MKRIFISKEAAVIAVAFLFSRLLAAQAGLNFDESVLLRYWQYLDIETLQQNLISGVWYDHTQPPVFNLLLGVILKLFPASYNMVFPLLLKCLTLVNALLIFCLLFRHGAQKRIALAFALFYVLSPATIVYEQELFYTSFITFLLLISMNALVQLQFKPTMPVFFMVFLPLSIVCLTRSMYHLGLLVLLYALVLLYMRKKTALVNIFLPGVICICFAGGWYVKNKLVFGQFTSSSWMGMNIARNVFHDGIPADSSKIEAIEPFSVIEAYGRFLPADYGSSYKGLNDRDLFEVYKNDSFINEKHIGYLELSKQYLEASVHEVKNNPGGYARNVLQSVLIFFTPATRYPSTEYQALKIKYYDLIYSFNLSHFATGKQERRIALAVSAIPKLLIYILVFSSLFRYWRRNKVVPLAAAFVLVIIAYIFCVSSLFEHYENMRFRFEIEPLFYLLAAMALGGWKTPATS